MTTRYLVFAHPPYTAGDEKYVITIEVVLSWAGEFDWEREFVRVRGQGHGERAAISTEQGVRFLAAMDLLHTEGFPAEVGPLPGESDYMDDGWDFKCQTQKEDGTRHEFSVSLLYLACERSSRQRAFMFQVIGLAWKVIRRPKTVQLLKQVRDAALRARPLPSG